MTGPVERCRSLRCAALLLALVGLFAMHGLGEHGTHDAGSEHGSMAMPAPAHLAHAAATPHAASLVGVSPAPTPPFGDDLPTAAGAMCLAVLGLLLGARLVVLIAARSTGRRPSWTRSSRPARAPTARGRAPDPPGRFVLSVQRC